MKRCERRDLEEKSVRMIKKKVGEMRVNKRLKTKASRRARIVR